MKATHELHLRAHRFLLGLVELLEHKLMTGQADDVDVALTTLARRLRLHLRIEDERVFPAIEAKLGASDFAPLAGFRREHNALRALLDSVVRAVEAGAPVAAALDVRELGMAFRLHAQEEEAVLYPLLESALGEEAQAELDALMAGEGA